MAALNWKASERCTTTPVPSSDRSLANVKFRLTMNEAPTPDEVRHLDDSALASQITPELLIDVDAPTLTSDTGLTKDEIVISAIVRDREIGVFKKIGQWPLDDLPGDLLTLNDLEDSHLTRLDVVIVATPKGSLDETDRFTPGTLLASKAFKIRAPSQKVDFPFKLVEPEEMAKEGYDRETVCCVRWKGEDISRSPSELIEVWLNKDLEDRYRVLNTSRGGPAIDHIARSIGAQVLGDVLDHVLGSDEESDDPDSLVNVVEDMIQRELGMSLDRARQIYQKGPDGRSRLMPWCWRLTRADRAFAGLTV